MKAGDYVRTEYGIAKIIDLKENPYGEKTIYILNKSIINIYDCDGCELACCNPFVEDMQDRFDTKFGDEKCIVKSSPNIIDLIEVGDYVNGDRVDAIGNKYVIFYDGDGDIETFEEDIKSIVTKEQFEAMEYKVGKYMTNEIKEILDRLEGRKNWYLHQQKNNGVFNDEDYMAYMLLDYITNLQEENERLKEWKEDLLNENIELENIRKEAIEYIKWQQDNPQYDNVWRKYECESLIKILQGEDNDNN